MFNKYMILTRDFRNGGLATGMHSVQLGIVIRKSYIPHADPENLFDFARTTLVPFLQAREGATQRMSLV